jgi:3-hydroxyisobutyrate dehydrogenase
VVALLDLRSYKGALPKTWVFLFAVMNCARLRPGASIDIYIDMRVKISIMGLGIMGAAMARSAARGGFDTTAWDRSPDRASSLASDSIHIAQCAGDAVQDADIVVTMVSNADAVLSIMKEREVLPAMKPGAVWIQMSTIGVEGTERASRLAGTRPEIGFLDAPVSGSKAAAEQGKLVILASGDQVRAGAAVQAFFDAIAAQTHWLGEVGQGTRMKLLFNAWIAALMEGVAEVSVLGDALGMDLGRFAALVSGGPLVPAWAVAKLWKIKEGRTAETEFPLRWAHKDVQLALAAAGEERARLPTLNQIDATWAEAEPAFGADDLSAIYLVLSNGVKR